MSVFGTYLARQPTPPHTFLAFFSGGPPLVGVTLGTCEGKVLRNHGLERRSCQTMFFTQYVVCPAVCLSVCMSGCMSGCIYAWGDRVYKALSTSTSIGLYSSFYQHVYLLGWPEGLPAGASLGRQQYHKVDMQGHFVQ